MIGHEQLIAAMDVRDDRYKDQLNLIGRSIGYGRAIQLLGHLWDDMMQASYPQVERHQEGLHRRTDIERIEAGLPLGRKLVYTLKCGRNAGRQITTIVPDDFAVPNVGRVISETWLFGRSKESPVSQQGDSQKGGE